MPISFPSFSLNGCFPCSRSEQIAPSFDLTQLRGRSPEEFGDIWKAHLDDVLKQLKEAPAETRKKLEPIINQLSFMHIQIFFQHLVEKEEKIPEDFFDCILASNVIESHDHLKKWAEEASEFIREEIAFHEPHNRSLHRNNLVTRFLPNLAYIFMRSFSLLQGERPPNSLYECGVLVTMYFNFFQIPYVLFVGLHAIIPDPWVVLATGTAIIGLAIGLLYSYLRWYKGCPSRIIHCENWSEQYAKRPTTQVIGRDKEYAMVKNSLDIPKAVLIHGAAGVGKTEFMKGLAAKFPEYRFFSFINGEVFSAGSWESAAADKILEAFREADGHQQIVFCLDEFGDTLDSSKNDLKVILKPLLGDKYPKIRFVTAITTEQWNQIRQTGRSFNDDNSENNKKDVALTQRFHAIELQSTSPNQTLAILLAEKKMIEKQTPISKKAVGKIIELGSENPGKAQPRNDVDTLRYLASEVVKFNPKNYETEELIAAKEKVEFIKLTGTRHKSIQDLNEAIANVAQIETKVEVQRQLAAKVMKLYRLKYEAQREAERLILKIKNDSNVTDHDRVKAFTLDRIYIPELKKRIKELRPGMDKGIHFRVDTEFVEAHFRKIQEEAEKNEQLMNSELA